MANAEGTSHAKPGCESHVNHIRIRWDRRSLIKKFGDARRTHANRSTVRHANDPTNPVYTAKELEVCYGWTTEAMHADFDDFMLGKCPCGCNRYALDLELREISVDIVNPELPPVWGVNTRWMCVPGNRTKANKTHATRIADELRRLRLNLPVTHREPPPPPRQQTLDLWHDNLPPLPPC